MKSLEYFSLKRFSLYKLLFANYGEAMSAFQPCQSSVLQAMVRASGLLYLFVAVLNYQCQIKACILLLNSHLIHSSVKWIQKVVVIDWLLIGRNQIIKPNHILQKVIQLCHYTRKARDFVSLQLFIKEVIL